MRIITLNANGIRRTERKGFLHKYNKMLTLFAYRKQKSPTTST
jgi:exonuclease III